MDNSLIVNGFCGIETIKSYFHFNGVYCGRASGVASCTEIIERITRLNAYIGPLEIALSVHRFNTFFFAVDLTDPNFIHMRSHHRLRTNVVRFAEPNAHNVENSYTPRRQVEPLSSNIFQSAFIEINTNPKPCYGITIDIDLMYNGTLAIIAPSGHRITFQLPESLRAEYINNITTCR